MGNLYRYTSNPIGYPAPFYAEQDMETFLYEHMGLLGDHLGTGDAEVRVIEVSRQMHLPKKRSHGRLDLVFLGLDQNLPVLYMAELKNEPIGKGAVRQLQGYLDAWRRESNKGNRATVARWLMALEKPPSEEDAERISRDVQGLLVGPSYLAEGVEAVVQHARDHPTMPVQALKLLRFRTGDGEGHVVLVDDVFTKPRKGQRITLRWVDLAARGLVTRETVFEMTCEGGTFEATPDFDVGRGKNLVLARRHRQAALKALIHAEERVRTVADKGGWEPDWEIDKLRQVHQLIQDGQSVPASNLSLYLQRAFGGLKEPDWQRPAALWRTKEKDAKGEHLFVEQLDAKLKG